MKKRNKRTPMHMSEGMDMKMKAKDTPERIYSFSDGIFAIIITIMILEFKNPESPTFEAVFKLWPTWLSYGVSYLFIAVVWINHHYLMRYAASAKLNLIWANFAHLFAVSFVPYLTEWLADSEFAPVPVAFYAFVFLLVNITYLWLIWETLCDERNETANQRSMHLLNLRSFITIGVFSASVVVAFWLPYVSFAMIVGCLILYTRPEIPKSGTFNLFREDM